MITHSVISPAHVAAAYTYKQYSGLAESLFAQNKTTSDDPHYNEPRILELTRLNFQRISRLNNTVVLLPELTEKLKNLPEEQIWLVLTESWCGDAAQSLPAINKMAEASAGKVALKLLLRDKNLDVMDAYLTNGGRSIPKLIALKADTLDELFTWGPRPAPVQQIAVENKKNNVLYDVSLQMIHTWYAKDKTHTLQQEFLSLLSE